MTISHGNWFHSVPTSPSHIANRVENRRKTLLANGFRFTMKRPDVFFVIEVGP